MLVPGKSSFLTPIAGKTPEPDATCRILIVDDDAPLRHTLSHALSKAGRSFDDCGSVAEAISLLERNAYELILLDYLLSDATGLVLLDWLAERRREEAVIMISGEDAIEAAIGALRHGADDYVRKPYHVAQLQRAVESALHKTTLGRANRLMSLRLRDSERLHRYLVESAPDLIFTLDLEGRFSYINPRVESLLGYSREVLMHCPFVSLVVPEDLDHAQALLAPDVLSSVGFNTELRLRRSNGELQDGGMASVTVSLAGLPILDDQHRITGLYGVARDISEQKRAEEIITFQAYYDQLTHLPNRVLFKDRLELAIAQAQRRMGALAVLFVDVDRFKLVNDTFGHAEGDALLRGIALRISATLRRGDTLARLGGDEFIILLPDISQPEDAETTVNKIFQALATPFNLSHSDFRATVSIGIALFPRDGTNAEDLTRHADIAMYQIKRSGKNGFRFFDSSLNVHHRERIALENDLRGALEQGEFELYYQPQVDLSRNQIVGMEALLRWKHPTHGFINPAVFIPLAEELGLIGEISRWVLEQACRQLALWRHDGHRELRMSINLSSHDFDSKSIVGIVTDCVTRHKLPPALIELEITESMMMRDDAGVAAKVRQLRGAGFGVAIDDFGTGYSSLAYLQKFPVSTLKIDRSFIRDLEGPQTSPIVSAIVAIARGFGLQLIAEGVEQSAQAETLRTLGCDVMQGYYFAYPGSASQAGHWLQTPPETVLL